MNKSAVIGFRIKELRTEKKYTLKYLSEQTGLSIGFLSQFERGLTSIAIDSLEKIAQVLEVELSSFFDLSSPQETKYVVRSYEKETTLVNSEIIEYALDQYNKHYKNTYKDTNFVLYQKYTYEDACRLLNWQHNEVPLNIGGYKYDQTTKTFPVFINYDKANDIQDTIKYEDHFINESQLIAISKSGRTRSDAIGDTICRKK